MTSKKRIAANRFNWQKGSGPRTKEGKAIASRNALRHGLGAMPNDATLRWIERISNAICGTDATLRERELATMIAESQVLIARVRAARRHAIERMRTASVTSQMPSCKFDAAKDRMMDAVRQNNFPRAVNILMRLSAKACRDYGAEVADEYLAKGSLRKGEIPPEVSSVYVQGKRIPRSDVESVCLAIPELMSLERYERRAMSRRRGAICTLGAIRHLREI